MVNPKSPTKSREQASPQHRESPLRSWWRRSYCLVPLRLGPSRCSNGILTNKLLTSIYFRATINRENRFPAAPFLPLPNLCALGALCGESLRLFRIKNLQILLRHPCCPFSRNSFISRELQPLAPLFALFFAPLPFVFNHFQPLFPKCRGWGYPLKSGTAIFGCPPTTSQQSSNHNQLADR